MKRISVILLLFTSLAFGQLQQRNPTNVRFIGAGYINKTPYFTTLKSALDNVKATAAIDNPYTFWIMSDTTYIPDWDSTYSGASMSIRDSINTYYVNNGKIKWAGFGQPFSSDVILNPTEHTYYYDIPKWNSVAPDWQDSLSVAHDVIDAVLESLIVYTNGVTYIENDTLKINIAALDSILLTRSFLKYDTTKIVTKTGNQTIDDIKEFTTYLKMSEGSSFTVPFRDTSYSATVTRAVIGDTARLYYDGNADGVERGLAYQDELTDIVAGIDSFTTTAQVDSVIATGITVNDIVTVSPRGTANANDILSIDILTNKFVVRRLAAGTSGLKYNYLWKRQ